MSLAQLTSPRWLATLLLIGMFQHGAARATQASDADAVKGELGERLHEHMNRLADGGFSGVLLAAKDGQVVIAKGYGLANREKQLPFTSATVFDIGSITKQFTGAAIADWPCKAS